VGKDYLEGGKRLSLGGRPHGQKGGREGGGSYRGTHGRRPWERKERRRGEETGRKNLVRLYQVEILPPMKGEKARRTKMGGKEKLDPNKRGRKMLVLHTQEEKM